MLAITNPTRLDSLPSRTSWPPKRVRMKTFFSNPILATAIDQPHQANANGITTGDIYCYCSDQQARKAESSGPVCQQPLGRPRPGDANGFPVRDLRQVAHQHLFGA